MAQQPTILERKALGFLFEMLSSSNSCVWGNYFWEQFSDLEPIKNSGMNLQEAQSVIQSLPKFAKRRIMHWVVMGWNEHHNLSVFKEAVVALVQTKACGPTEYFCLQYMVNFINEFQNVCNSLNNIEIKQNMFTPYKYDIRFGWKSPNHNIVFELNKPTDTPIVVIAPMFRLLQDKYGTERDLDKLVSEHIVPLFLNEFTKEVVPIANSDMRFGFCPTRNNDGIVIGLKELVLEYL